MTRRWAAGLRAVLDRPRLWRVTAVLAALLLCGVVAALGQGSLNVLAQRPEAGSVPWAPWCTAGQVREDRHQLAFCARVDGLAVASTHGPGAGEAHVAVIGDFHLTIVRLPPYTRTPSPGTRVIAIGPL